MRYPFLCVILLAAGILQGQNILETEIPPITEEQPLEVFLTSLEKKVPVRFFFKSEWISSITVKKEVEVKTLGYILSESLRDAGVGFGVLHNYSIILTKGPNLVVERLLLDALYKKKVVKKQVFGNPAGIRNKQVRLKGRVIAEKTDDAASGVTVVVDNAQNTTTDANGDYELVMPDGNHVVAFSHLNFEDKIIDLEIYENSTMDIQLNETPYLLDEVVVVDEATRNVSTRGLGFTSIKPQEIKRLPTFLGEVDIIKQLQTQPGVTTVGEGAAGFNVRGGSVDQNLVLLDGTPVFNVSHAFGFFTAFNSDAVRSIDFYRGGIPAEYGGRTSSVLSVTTREGDYNKWHAAGGLGILTSNLAVEGPIKNDKTTIYASARSTYSDWLLKTINSNYGALKNSTANFYDGSLKVAHKFSNQSKLVVSGYASHDIFRLTNDTTYSWGSATASVRYDHAFNEKLFMTAQISYGQYKYQVEDEDPVSGFQLNYEIKYPSLRWDWNYHAGEHKISFGLQSTYYSLSPGTITGTTSGSNVLPRKMDQENGLESAIYVSDFFSINQRLDIEPGLRVSMFNRLGPGKVFSYAPGQPIEAYTRTDTTLYSQGSVMKTYVGLEPRLTLRYALTERASIKVGYNRTIQYLQLISNTASVTAVDIWELSNTHIKPQIADQISGGYFRQTRNNHFELSAEVFYKTVQNVLDYRDGANLILNTALETAVLPGRAKAYGLELSASKLTGKLTGAINYTYSRSLRQVDGPTPAEKINNGDYYPSNFDQPHIFNMNWRLGITRRIFFSGMFTYHTGRPVSVPISAYSVGGIFISNFSERNQFRIPDYHRLDLAFVFEGNHKRKKPWTGSWVISCYNVYGRKNAYSVFFQDVKNKGLQAYKLAVIGTMVPSITYNFRF